MDNFFSDPEFIFHILLQIFITKQHTVAALPAARRGVGDVAPVFLPADLVALALHQRYELLAVSGMTHTVVDDIHELQLPALTAGSGMILAGGHGLCFLSRSPGFEHRKRKLHAHLIVTLTQFLKLLLCDVELSPCVEVDGVDEEVGMDMVAVRVGADQNLIPLIVFGQLQCGRVSGERINGFIFREALHHVVEHHASGLAIETLRCHEVGVDAFRLTVDPCDQSLTVPERFLVLHGVAHHGAHASAAMAPFVIRELDNCHVSPTLPLQDHPNGAAEVRERIEGAVQIDHCDSSHMRQSDELVEISANELQLFQHFLQSVDDDHLPTETAARHIVAHGHTGLLRQLFDCFPVIGSHSGAELDIFLRIDSSNLS